MNLDDMNLATYWRTIFAKKYLYTCIL